MELDQIGQIEFTRAAWYGLDFRWYGIDRDGNVGVFDSGYLPIPSRVFCDEASHRETVAFMSQLSAIGRATADDKLRKQVTGSGKLIDCSSRLSDAEKGLFVYDEIDYIGWRYLHGYYRAASPIKPLLLHDLPESIRNALSDFQFPISFANCVELEVERYFDCR